MTTAITAAPIRTRLPVPAGINVNHWRVLTEAIFPNAKTPEAILLAMEYCKARNLDILKKPVNIVPTWSSQLRREVETVWPAITEAQVTAARTHEWAGLGKPVYGETKTTLFKGRREDDRGNWVDAQVTVTYPEWCERTVYRMIGGAPRAFTERVYWVESYARHGGSTLPNAMWCKRPFDQFAKVAKAAALRAAFPEEDGGPTAEQMEGQDIAETDLIEAAPATSTAEGTLSPEAGATGGVQPSEDPSSWTPPTQPDHDLRTGEVLDETTPEELEREANEDWRDWGQRFLARIAHAQTVEIIDEWMKLNQKTLEQMLAEAQKIHARLVSAVGRHRLNLMPPTAAG